MNFPHLVCSHGDFENLEKPNTQAIGKIDDEIKRISNMGSNIKYFKICLNGFRYIN